MALNKGNSTGSNVSDIAQARRERLDKSTIAYGRRHGDDKGGPNKQAILEAKNKPNVRPVLGGRKFDREKVDQIKADLASGTYQINPLQIADMFIDHERHC